jgi:uncharacterized protein YndB with AHSA1/START domain
MTDAPTATTARELTIRRVYDAPRELVWEAWTEPERLARWWGKRGWSTPVSTITMDVRPGGVFRLTSFSDDDGAAMPSDATYTEVVEGERLAFAEHPRAGCHEGATGAVTLTDRGDGSTEMVFTTTIHATGEIGEAAARGMTSAFDRLAEHLA